MRSYALLYEGECYNYQECFLALSNTFFISLSKSSQVARILAHLLNLNN